MKTDLSKYNNKWYKNEIGASRLMQIVWYLINSIFFSSRMFPVSRLKVKVLKIFGATIGTSVIIKPDVNIKYPWKLKIGSNCWIGERVWIDNLAPVIIGDNVCLSQGAFLLTGNHDYSKTTFDLIVKPIHIEDGVWIGAKAIVCPGVTCKTHSVLTANSVAVNDLLQFKIYQGNPATEKKERVILE